MKETHYKLKHRVTALFAAAVMLCSIYQNYQGEVELESVFRLHKQSKENRAPKCRGLEQAA